MTRTAFDLARRAVVGSATAPEGTAWRAHGDYLLKGVEDPVGVFEVGVEGEAPLSAPPNSEKAKRSVAAGEPTKRASHSSEHASPTRNPNWKPAPASAPSSRNC